jgi:hypothetical protein
MPDGNPPTPTSMAHRIVEIMDPYRGHRLAAAGNAASPFIGINPMETPIRHYQPGNLNSKAATMRLRAQSGDRGRVSS